MLRLMATDDLPILVIAPDRSVPRRLQAVWRYRELLVGLVRKELKVKYKDSSLGFFWSMLNPAMYLPVFYVVFQIIIDRSEEHTYELQPLMRTSYAVFCWKTNNTHTLAYSDTTATTKQTNRINVQ